VRGFLLPLALLALAGSALTATDAPPRGEVMLTAVGRSLGGLRVLLEDVLFLRAESLRADGRVEAVSSLYESVRALDPDDVHAIDFLASVYAFDLLPDAPDAEARFGWWRAARALLRQGLARRPGDPLLLISESDLLLRVGTDDPPLQALIAREVPDPEVEGLVLLMQAARASAYVGRRGRSHLMALSLAIPVVAAHRLDADPATAERLLAMGDELLRIRRPALEALVVPWEEGGELRMDVALEAGLQAVRAWRDHPDPAARKALLATLRAKVPGLPVADVLERGAR
jgi:hypothetical protein